MLIAWHLVLIVLILVILLVPLAGVVLAVVLAVRAGSRRAAERDELTARRAADLLRQDRGRH